MLHPHQNKWIAVNLCRNTGNGLLFLVKWIKKKYNTKRSGDMGRKPQNLSFFDDMFGYYHRNLCMTDSFKTLLSARGMRQKDFARLFEINEGYLSQVLQKKRTPSKRVMSHIHCFIKGFYDEELESLEVKPFKIRNQRKWNIMQGKIVIHDESFKL